jgi:hypothetical protein
LVRAGVTIAGDREPGTREPDFSTLAAAASSAVTSEFLSVSSSKGCNFLPVNHSLFRQNDLAPVHGRGIERYQGGERQPEMVPDPFPAVGIPLRRRGTPLPAGFSASSHYSGAA